MSTSAVRARQREQRENTRREILAAADRLLRERPYRELSVDLVMAQTGLTRTAFYRHFDDVPDLVLRLLADVGRGLYTLGERWRAGATDDFASAAREGLSGIVEFFAAHGPLVRAVADAAATDEQIERGYAAFLDVFTDMIREGLDELVERGQLEVPDTRALALALNLMNERYPARGVRPSGRRQTPRSRSRRSRPCGCAWCVLSRIGSTRMCKPRSGLAIVAAVGAALLGAPVASGAPVLPTQDPFYTYTGSLAAVSPGTVLKTRPITVQGSSVSVAFSASQVLYRTTGELGQPTVTVATILKPLLPVPPRIVSYQTAYDALGAQCDPSYTLRGGSGGDTTASAEEQLISLYIAAGDTVVVPDYEGTNLDWGAGQESGYGTLDGIRAAERVLGLAAASTPVAMVGYSGGSIATEFASELQPTYAPSLDLVGTAEGGVPVDFAHNLDYINGSKGWSGVIPAVLVGVGRAFKLNVAQYASAYGLQVAHQVQDQCINSFYGNYPGLTIQKLLKPRYQNFLGIPVFASITNHLIMSGTGTPKGPLFIGVGNADGTGDGVMVAADVQALAHTYCQRGVSVQFNEYKNDDHTAAAIPFEAGAVQFITERLNGLAVSNGCSSIGPANSLAPLPVATVATLRLRVRHVHGGLKLSLRAVGGTLRGLVVEVRRHRAVVATIVVQRLTASWHRVRVSLGPGSYYWWSPRAGRL